MSRMVNHQLIKRQRCDGAVTKKAIVVKGTADGDVKLPTAADVGGIVGIALEAGADNEMIDVLVQGIGIAIAGAAITDGVPVSIHGTAGKVKAAAPGAGTNTFLVGFARGTAAADLDEVSVELAKSVMQG